MPWHWNRSTTSHPSASAVRWQKSLQGLFISYVYGYSADFLFLFPPDSLPVCSYLSVPLFFFFCRCVRLSVCLSTACLFSVSSAGLCLFLFLTCWSSFLASWVLPESICLYKSVHLTFCQPAGRLSLLVLLHESFLLCGKLCGLEQR